MSALLNFIWKSCYKFSRLGYKIFKHCFSDDRGWRSRYKVKKKRISSRPEENSSKMSIGFIWYLSLYDRSRVKQKYILTLTLKCFINLVYLNNLKMKCLWTEKSYNIWVFTLAEKWPYRTLPSPSWRRKLYRMAKQR